MISLLLSAPFFAPPAPQAPLRLSGGDAVFAERVFHDADEARDLWARGVRWKMRFSPAGATFLPLFGRGQERHHPLELSPRAARIGSLALPLKQAAEPVRAGDRVTFDRGSLLEVYDLVPGAVEQSFVFPDVPRGGELVLALELRCDLPGENTAQGGVELRHELGTLCYSQALAIDGLGRRLPLETRLDGSTLGIRIPAWFLDLAQAPLVVDPIVKVFPIELADLYQDYAGDVSFDATTQRWLVVWERALTATDTDVLYVFFSEGGAIISGGYLNQDAQQWWGPVAANLNAYDAFYVAANVPGSVGSRSVKGRALPASAPPGSPGGPVYTVSQPTLDKLHPIVSVFPRVGGDPSPLASHKAFCVVWEENDALLFRRVEAGGVPLGSVALLPGSDGVMTPPCMSGSNDGTEWVVAFSQGPWWDIKLAHARIGWGGQVTQAPQPVPGSGSSSRAVSSSVGGRIIANTSDSLVALAGAQVLDLEPFTLPILDADLAEDGQHFVLAYTTSSGMGFLTLGLTAADQIVTLEHSVGGYAQMASKAGLATRQESGGAAGRAVQTWAATSSSPVDLDVFVTFYQPL